MNDLSDKVILIGFMGVGKTRIGRQLAAALQRPFVDLDALIEARTGATIAQLFEQRGEAWFRKLEREVLADLLEQEGAQVLATGGGAPCTQGSMELMLSKGVVVWLQVDAAMLSSRLQHRRAKRPLLASLQGEELSRFVSAKLQERRPYYAQAHLCMDVANFDKERLSALVAALSSYTR